MNHHQILIATEAVSDVFPSVDAAFSTAATFYVRLQGTIGNTWDIESALADVAEASRVWVSETGGNGYTTDDQVSGEFPLGAGLIYRVNLGTGNAGPIGYVHETRIATAR